MTHVPVTDSLPVSVWKCMMSIVAGVFLRPGWKAVPPHPLAWLSRENGQHRKPMALK